MAVPSSLAVPSTPAACLTGWIDSQRGGRLHGVDVANALAGDRWLLNHAVYQPGQTGGHYESFYQRANHPTRPLAFWLRYTIFAPAGDPAAAIGELWAVLFNGETGEHAVAKSEMPISDCTFARDAFDVRIGTSTLDSANLAGSAGDISWDLTYAGDEPPLLLLPAKLYNGALPKAKSLVPLPQARFDGTITAAGESLVVDGWVGSQNHNWGSQHTDRYAFGQVAGFDDRPDAYLEVATVKARLAGPIFTPWLTTAVLRLDGVEHSLVSIRDALKAKARYRYFDWTFETGNSYVEISGHISARANDFVGLRYGNPPGGIKHCLNTKIARAELTVHNRANGSSQTLRTDNRALFEILTDPDKHGVTLRA